MDDMQKALFNLAVARFWSKVNKLGPDECWNWQASTIRSGYGQVSFLGEHWLAHRKAYQLVNGEIPVGGGYHGTVVMHSCDNRLCCNPAHLSLGTQAMNVKDMDRKGRADRKENRPTGERHHAAVLTDAQRSAIISDKRGHSDVAREYGISPQLVFYVRKSAGASQYKDGRSNATKGSQNPNALLNDDAVRAMRLSTEKPGVLAKRYGITPDYVTKIRKRQAWAHIE